MTPRPRRVRSSHTKDAHAIDRHLRTADYPKPNLEFTAKLSEIAFAPEPRLAFGAILSSDIGNRTSHGTANARVDEGYRVMDDGPQDGDRRIRSRAPGTGPVRPADGRADAGRLPVDGPARPERRPGPQVIKTQAPAVDGDGVNWIVAYERNFPQSGDEDIACRGCELRRKPGRGLLERCANHRRGGVPTTRSCVPPWVGSGAQL